MNRLREIREARGYTCRQIADKLGVAEMSVSRYERDEGRLKVSILRKLARILDATVGQILGETPFDHGLTAKAEGVGIDRQLLESVMDSVDAYLKKEGATLDTHSRAGLYLRIHDFAKDMPTKIDEAMIAKLVTLALRK